MKKKPNYSAVVEWVRVAMTSPRTSASQWQWWQDGNAGVQMAANTPRTHGWVLVARTHPVELASTAHRPLYIATSSPYATDWVTWHFTTSQLDHRATVTHTHTQRRSLFKAYRRNRAWSRLAPFNANQCQHMTNHTSVITHKARPT